MAAEGANFDNQEPHKRLVAWQRSVDFVVIIYELTGKLPKEEEFGLKRNYAEPLCPFHLI